MKEEKRGDIELSIAKRIRKSYLLVFSILIVLFLLVGKTAFSDTNNVPDVIGLDKLLYNVGEVVNIRIGLTNFSNSELIIVTDSHIYKSSNVFESMSFIPKDTGLSTVQFYQDSVLLDSETFNVIVRTINLTNAIYTDKKSYFFGETVYIFSNVSSETFNEENADYELSIVSRTSTYKFLGIPDNSLKFIPKDSGNYSVQLMINNTVVFEYIFFVSELNITLPQNRKFKIVNNNGDLLDSEINLMKNGDIVSSFNSLSSPSIDNGIYDLEIKPNINGITGVSFKNLNISTFNFGLEDIPTDKLEFTMSNPAKRAAKAYAIDPTRLEFESAVVTSVAAGKELWKCRDWNFSEQKCYGEWIKIMDLIPGQEYSFNLTAEDPGYIEIFITKAVHLDENRTFIADVFDYVNSKDNIFAEISSEHYVRVTFEKNLTSDKDITIYAKSNYSNSSVEVYEKDGTEKIADFGIIDEYEKYQIFLNNLEGSQDTFDLKIIGNPVEFDYIIDPTFTPTVLTYDDFESDLGSYTDGGGDVARVENNEYCAGDSDCMDIQDDSAPPASTFYHTNDLDVHTPGYTNIKVEFFFQEVGMNNGHDWFFDYWDGSVWQVRKQYITGAGTDSDTVRYVSNSVEYTDTIWINETNYTFSTTFKLRFRCSAGGNDDDVYIDNINVSGWLDVNTAPTQSTPKLNSTLGTNTTNENLTCYNQSTSDVDGDSVKNIFNWYKNGAPLAKLNMPFEGGSNSTYTRDYSGYGNDGSPVNVNYNATGGYGGTGAYNFRGIDGSYINIPDSTSLSFTNPGITIAAWVYLNQDQTGERAIVRKENQWQLGIFPADNMLRNLIATSGTTGWTADNDEAYTINANTWYFFAFTYNGSVLKHYVNGQQIGTDKTVTGNIVDNANNASIGANTNGIAGGGAGALNGTIDEVLIINKSLSAEQIYALYQNRTDLIVASETSIGDVWMCQITPNDRYSDGTASNSSFLTVLAGFVDTSPNVILQTPTDNYWNDTSTPVNVTFNCSITDDFDSVNISLYLTNYQNQSFAYNDSCNIAAVNGSCQWSKFLAVGNYTWNCLGYDNNSQYDWGTSNRSIKINFTIKSYNWDGGTGDWLDTGHWLPSGFTNNANDVATISSGIADTGVTSTFYPNLTLNTGGTIRTPNNNGRTWTARHLILAGGTLYWAGGNSNWNGTIHALAGTTSILNITGTYGQNNVNHILEGSGTINKTGNSYWNLALQSENFSGVFNINEGEIRLSSGTNTFGNSNSRMTIKTGGTLERGNSVAAWTFPGGIILNGGTFLEDGNNGLTLNSNLTVQSNSMITVDGPSTGNRGWLKVTGALNGTGNLTIYTTNNSRGVSFTGAGNYNGTITLENQSYLYLGNTNVFHQNTSIIIKGNSNKGILTVGAYKTGDTLTNVDNVNLFVDSLIINDTEQVLYGHYDKTNEGLLKGYVVFNNDYSSITILGSGAPIITNTNCYVSSSWVDCDTVTYGQRIDSVRTKCYPGNLNGSISNVSYYLKNIDDNKIYFNSTTTDNSSGYWELNIPDLTIYDSGDFDLHITCRENPESEEDINWSIPFGTLSASLISPTTNINVTRNRFFNFTSRITCAGGECGYINATLDPVNWWNNDWARRKDINITNVGGTALNNFTAYLRVSYDSDMLSNFSDIRFLNGTCDSNGTALDYEIENYNSTDANVWVRLPTLSTGVNKICMYYGNPGAASGENSSATWDSNYEIVAHLSESPTGTVDDSTSNNNDGSSGGSMTSGDLISGIVGGAIEFDGTDDQIIFGTTARPTNSFTFEAWMKTSETHEIDAQSTSGTGGTSGQNYAFGANWQNADGGSGLSIGTNGISVYEHGAGYMPSLATYSAAIGSGWNHVVVVYTAKQPTIYLNGRAVHTGLTSLVPNVYAPYYIGSGSYGQINGPMDEVRVSTGTRSANWINQSYQMMTYQSTFVRFATEESRSKGIISTTPGATPFYTTTANPMYSTTTSCLGNMTSGNTCDTTWSVNATGYPGIAWEFFAEYLSMNYSANVSAANTSKIYITIVENTAPTVTGVSISPSFPSVSLDLNCTFIVSDTGYFDILTANVSWYKNGALAYSEIVGVNSGVQTTRILGSGNTSAGEVWNCGIKPYDQIAYGTQVNSSTVTVLATLPPAISNIQCQENGITWGSCSNVLYFNNLTAVRAACYDSDGYPLNVSFTFKNIEDSRTFFSGTTTDNSTGQWTYNNNDIFISDSGTFNLTVVCYDNSNTSNTSNVQWTVPWGTLSASLISPSTNINVTRNRFFNFTSRITCSGGECGYINATLDPVNWWDNAWTRRKQINITGISSAVLTDFPAYLNISYDADMRSDLYDLRFINGSCGSGSTLLAYEIENYTSSRIHAWVRILNLSPGENLICMYYGNSGAANGENKSGVWSNNYSIVSHMNDNPSGTVDDSTSNNNHGSSSGSMDSSDLVAGIVGQGIDFDGGNDKITFGATNRPTNTFTYEAWMQTSSTQQIDSESTSGVGGVSGQNYSFWPDHGGDFDSGAGLSVGQNGISNYEHGGGYMPATAVYSSSIGTGWNYIVVVYNAKQPTIYLNGVAVRTGLLSPRTNVYSPRIVGGESYGWFDGPMDEVRISNGTRSAGWINQSFRMITNQTAYVSFREEEMTKNLVSTVQGTLPFYTTTANPMYSTTTSCLGNMTSGNTCDTTWSVNATGLPDSTWEFFAGYESMNYSAYLSSINTASINITIVSNSAPIASNVSISPLIPISSSTLNCSFIIRDSSYFDTLTANITWYKNNISNFSEVVSVSNGVRKDVYLGSGNTTPGETWHCGVTPRDQDTAGTQVNSSIVLIYLAAPPVLNQIQCYENNNIWTSCSNLVFNDNFSGVRINCTSDELTISNVTINFTNVPDSQTYFNVTTTVNSGDWWYYYFNRSMNNSGEYAIYAICRDNSSQTDADNLSWSLPWGILNGTLVNPASNTNVERNAFFNFTAKVECMIGECGDVNATLDPVTNYFIDGFESGSLGNWTETGAGYWTVELDPAAGHGDYSAHVDGTGGAAFEVSNITLANSINLQGQTNCNLTFYWYRVANCEVDDEIYLHIYDGSWNSRVWQTSDTTGSWQYVTIDLDASYDLVSNFNIKFEGYANGGNDDQYIDDVNISCTEPTKSGAISMVPGTLPFYTTSQNPTGKLNISCLGGMIKGQACQVSWLVNATGSTSTTHEFWVDFNMSTNQAYVSDNQSRHINITITDSSLVPPIVTLEKPDNNNISNSSTVIFNCSATDNLGLRNMTLYGNFGGTFAANGTNELGGTSNSTTFARTLSDGVYTWNCLAYDTNGNIDWGNSNRTLTVDTTKPSINLSGPRNGESYETSSLPFNFTVYDALDSILVCNITIDSVVRDLNFNANNNSPISRTISSLTQGIHWWNVTCLDNAGNRNTSATWNFTISDVPPTVVLITQSPIYQQSISITLQYNATDNNNITQARLILNGQQNATNNTVENGAISNFTLTGLSQGRYNWTVNVSDISNLTAQGTPIKWFTVDYTDPAIELKAPQNKSQITTSSYYFNYTVIDNLDTQMICNITINGTVRDLNYNANNASNNSRQVANLVDGVHYWNVTCIDDSGNSNTSETIWFNISSSPTVTLNSPGLTHSQNTPNITFFYTPADNTNLSSCSLIINGAVNKTNTTIFNNIQNNFTIAGFSSGYYNWTVNCTDKIGLTTIASPVRNITIDISKPTITLYMPLLNETIFANIITFNYSVIDDVDINLSCNITLDGRNNQTFIPSSNNTYVARNITIRTDGTHWWNVTCWDDSGNSNTSETRNFTIKNPPTIYLYTPENNTLLNYLFNVSFSYWPDDADGILNASIIINNRINQTDYEVSNIDVNYFYVNFSSDGIYYWAINATDSTGMEGASQIRKLTIDTTKPIVTYVTPYEDENLTWNNVTFTFNVTDNLDGQMICNITINGVQEFSNISVNNGSSVTRYKDFNDGSYNWSVTCIDHANWTNTYVLTNFTVEAPPNITLNFPVNNHTRKNQSVQFNYTPRDLYGLENCTLILNGEDNETSQDIDQNVPNYFTLENLPHGHYNWTVNCTDYYPDLNSYAPPEEFFFIDILGPSIELIEPDEGNFYNYDDINFTFNATDQFGLPTQLICNITIDRTVNVSNITLTSGQRNTTLIQNIDMGQHNWSVACIDALNNSATSIMKNFTVNAPDLTLNSTHILFNNTDPEEGKNITINATIFNVGGITANNILVQFFDGNPTEGGTQIDGNKTITSLQNGNNATINVSWFPTLGIHEIWVLIDPDNSIVELNNTNNNASRTINVSIWQTVYGNVSGTLIIDKPSINYSAYRWIDSNSTNSNIFVTDYDSDIDWQQLRALGINSTEGLAFDDFLELDSELGTENYTDSINNTYTLNSAPRLKTDFWVIRTQITNVSIVNSTNSTNFYTGILWDYSDGGNEYNGTQDVLFVTKVNENGQGKFGIYDFEIKFPSRLKNYQGPNSNSVIFYTEIK